MSRFLHPRSHSSMACFSWNLCSLVFAVLLAMPTAAQSPILETIPSVTQIPRVCHSARWRPCGWSRMVFQQLQTRMPSMPFDRWQSSRRWPRFGRHWQQVRKSLADHFRFGTQSNNRRRLRHHAVAEARRFNTAGYLETSDRPMD